MDFSHRQYTIFICMTTEGLTFMIDGLFIPYHELQGLSHLSDRLHEAATRSVATHLTRKTHVCR